MSPRKALEATLQEREEEMIFEEAKMRNVRGNAGHGIETSQRYIFTNKGGELFQNLLAGTSQDSP